MSVNYVSDNNGATIAIQIPIEDWKRIKNKYPDIDDLNGNVPEWQMKMMEQRLKEIEKDPQSVQDIAGLFEELDKEID